MTMLKVYIHTHTHGYDEDLCFSSAKSKAVNVTSAMLSGSASSGMWLTANKDAGGVMNFKVL